MKQGVAEVTQTPCSSPKAGRQAGDRRATGGAEARRKRDKEVLRCGEAQVGCLCGGRSGLADREARCGTVLEGGGLVGGAAMR